MKTNFNNPIQTERSLIQNSPCSIRGKKLTNKQVISLETGDEKKESEISFPMFPSLRPKLPAKDTIPKHYEIRRYHQGSGKYINNAKNNNTKKITISANKKNFVEENKKNIPKLSLVSGTLVKVLDTAYVPPQQIKKKTQARGTVHVNFIHDNISNKPPKGAKGSVLKQLQQVERYRRNCDINKTNQRTPLLPHLQHPIHSLSRPSKQI